MTDRGQRIVGGGDHLEVPVMPLPPQPPAESEREGLLRRHRAELDEWWEQMIADEESGKLERLAPVESPDLPIPEAALEAMCDLTYRGEQVSAAHAKALLAAALPHLRSLQVETQVEYGRALGRREAAEEVTELLAPIDNALRNGSYMTKANLAFIVLCEQWGVDPDLLDAVFARQIGKGAPNG